MGHWIGGDRDGNPNVNAETMAHALSRQSETALRFYLDEVNQLGAELSMSQFLVPVSKALRQLAAHAHDGNAHRADEPYRRALTGIYARLAATLRQLTGQEARVRAVSLQPAYADAAAFCGDLQIVADSLQAHHGGAMVGMRLGPLLRAVQVFGFHLATLDLRQNSEQHAMVIAELLRVARVEDDYQSLPEERRRTLLLLLLNDTRGLRVRDASYSALLQSELAVFD